VDTAGSGQNEKKKKDIDVRQTQKTQLQKCIVLPVGAHTERKGKNGATKPMHRVFPPSLLDSFPIGLLVMTVPSVLD
jgi:hypothetical protein